jgi:membrane peptidoglycan carboxypeptidase
VIWDVYSDFGGYVPTNYDSTYHGPDSMRASLANSLNVPAVKTMNYIGLERWTEFAKQIGLRFPLGDPVERSAGLQTALGGVEVRLFDMVGAYAMLANNGRRIDPYAILYIQDRSGNEIYRANTSPEGLQVVAPEYAYLITSILSDNEARVPEFGAGWPLELQGGRIAAVKTGSTNDNRDALTVGYTPQFVVGVWVGNTDNRPMYGITGYAGAAPIWNQIMETIHTGLEVQQFTQPAGLTQMEVCNDSGTQPSQACAGRTHYEIFASSALPPGPDKDIFRTLEVDDYTGKLVNQYCQNDVQERTFVAIDDPTAYNWINNTAEGNAWAQSRGIDTPVMPPPTEFCDANTPRPYVVLSSPAENQTVQGTIQLRGAVTMPDFNRYEVRVGATTDPESFSQPVIVDTNQRPDGESILGEYDTRQLDNGPYTLRLVVIDNFGRDVTRDVHITVNNPEPTPEPTSLPTPTLAPTLDGSQFQPTPQPGEVTIAAPTAAPTMTPTWTLTPTPQ